MDASLPPDDLTPEQRELLAYLLEDENVAAENPTAIMPHPGLGEAPLSFAQRSLWLIDQLAPGNPVYNIPLALRFDGALDLEALTRSLREIVARHDILRTTFNLHDGKPVQVIAPTLELPLEEHETKNLLQQLTDFARRGFDLRLGPLWRVGLFRESMEQHVLLLVLHHTLADGWSVNVLLNELLICYRAFAEDNLPNLPPLPIRYVDYAIWQEKFLSSESYAKQLDFWKRELMGAPAILNLPSDRPHPVTPTFAGAQHTFSLDQATRQALERFSQVHGLTLFTTLAAAFGVLLSRYTRQKDLLVGIPPAGRTQRETEGLIGHFADSIVLRFDLTHDLPVSAYLQRVKTALQWAFSHQDVPFEQIVEALQPERDPSRNPLFQVMLAFEKSRDVSTQVGELRISSVPVQTNVSRVDLTLMFTETADGLSGSWEYSTDLFDGTSLKRLTTHYQVILQTMLTRPEVRLSEIEMLTPDERTHILGAWNDTFTEIHDERLAHQLIEARAATAPQMVALLAAGQQISYGELNRQANQLARRLRRLGVGPESVVGVLVERSVNMVVAELAIMKAGGAFLPLDPAYPAERLVYMVRDSHAQLIISLVPLPGMSVPVISLADDWPNLTREDASDLENLATEGNLAYLIYTSGSTGQPKGVMIEHRNLRHLLAWHRDTYGLTPGERAGWLGSPSFDLSVLEIWPVLAAGATLVIAEDESRYDPAHLKTWLAEQRIRVNFIPTVVLETILNENWSVELALEYVLTGADKLTRRPPLGFKPQLMNLYGPTEITVLTSSAHIMPGPGADPPIGRPIANTQLYILDEHLNLVPPGVPGELCVGGLGVGRGYFERPTLTAEKFIPNPFWTVDGGRWTVDGESAKVERYGLRSTVYGRLYRTGDLCSFLPDGNIRFIGRIDRQVKIRGMRIELGEIKSALLQHPAVKDAVVQVWEDARGEKRLVAYFIPHDVTVPAQPALRAFLKERLPSYMLPAVFIFMDAWPTDANAKFDARALPAPEPYFHKQGSAEAPVTELQKQLHEIWCAVIGIREAGLNDNFFDLGGHSLLAMQLLGRIESTLGLRLPLAAFFQSPTLAGVAQYLKVHRNSHSEAALVGIRSAGTKLPIFFIHGGMGTVLPFYELAGQIDSARPIYALAGGGSSIEALARAYLAEVRRAQPDGPYVLCGWSMGGSIAYEMGRQLHAAGQARTRVIMLDSWCPAQGESFSEIDSLREFSVALLDQPLLSEPAGEKVDEWLTSLLSQGKHIKKLAENTQLGEIKRLYETYCSNVRAWFAYKPVSYPANLTLFRAAESLARYDAPLLGWERLTGLPLNVLDVPGSHYTLLREPHVRELAGWLNGFLEG